MVLKGDSGPVMEGDDMFSLKLISDRGTMNRIAEQRPELVAESESEDETRKVTKKRERYVKGEGHLDSSGLYYKDSESELEMESDEEIRNEEGLGKYL